LPCQAKTSTDKRRENMVRSRMRNFRQDKLKLLLLFMIGRRFLVLAMLVNNLTHQEQKVKLATKTSCQGMNLYGLDCSRQDVLTLLNDDLTVSDEFTYGGVQFGCGRVQLHAQKLVIDLQDLHGLLKVDLEPELALQKAEGIKDRCCAHGVAIS
jgi:hypothetical protein